jgi:hypothetical protein
MDGRPVEPVNFRTSSIKIGDTVVIREVTPHPGRVLAKCVSDINLWKLIASGAGDNEHSQREDRLDRLGGKDVWFVHDCV